MRVEYDRSWLLQIRARRSRGDPWQHEVARFFQAIAPSARGAARRVQAGMGIRHSQTDSDVDDIVAISQAKFTSRAIDAYREECQPTTYFLRIVVTSAVSFYRHPWARAEQPAGALAPRRDAGADPLERLLGGDTPHDRYELWRDLHGALRRAYAIQPDYAEAVDLFLFQGFGSSAECAARVGTTEENFHKRVSRGRRLLQSLLLQGGYRDG